MCICKISVSSFLLGKNSNFKPHSNCSCFYAFSLAPVEKAGTFCSNRSVVCKICRNIFWSYNMRYHYEDFHQGAKFDTEFIISDLEKRNILNSNKI